MDKKYDIAAIVVTYHPEINSLQRLLDALKEPVDSTILVDNGSGLYLRNFFNSRRQPNECLIRLGANLGVAAAHNAGIERARLEGKTHVILFDQDSMPAPDMVFLLSSAMRRLVGRGVRVAAVGPRFEDARNLKRPSFMRVSGLKIHKICCEQDSDEIVQSDMIISSGSLISLASLAEIGGALNELFIDQVDMEWCFRAGSRGYSCFGVCNALMRHSLGEEPKSFLGRKFVHQSPLRHYYIFRNAVWLLFRRYVPMAWKFIFIRSIVVRFLVYACFVAPRRSYLLMMTKGIRDGLFGRLGKFQGNRQLD